MLLNELAQWAVLVFVAITVIGLTRQLGNFLVPARDRVARDTGPDVGKRLPAELFGSERHQLLDLLKDRFLFLLVSESCDACEDALDALIGVQGSRSLPVFILSRESSAAHRDKLAVAGDLLNVDSSAADAANLLVTPFVAIADQNFRVIHKEIPVNLMAVLRDWDPALHLSPSGGAVAAHRQQVPENPFPNIGGNGERVVNDS